MECRIPARNRLGAALGAARLVFAAQPRQNGGVAAERASHSGVVGAECLLLQGEGALEEPGGPLEIVAAALEGSLADHEVRHGRAARAGLFDEDERAAQVRLALRGPALARQDQKQVAEGAAEGGGAGAPLIDRQGAALQALGGGEAAGVAIEGREVVGGDGGVEVVGTGGSFEEGEAAAEQRLGARKLALGLENEAESHEADRGEAGVSGGLGEFEGAFADGVGFAVPAGGVQSGRAIGELRGRGGRWQLGRAAARQAEPKEAERKKVPGVASHVPMLREIGLAFNIQLP
jgi:hypothetical protein